jgi:hypothetical protein
MPNYTPPGSAVNFHLTLKCQYCDEDVERSVYRDKVTCFDCNQKNKRANHLAWTLKRNPQYAPRNSKKMVK